MSLEQTPSKSMLPRIVTVDDDPRIRTLMKMQLQGIFPEIAMFEDPLDVLHYLSTNPRDVLITDGMMPQMRGEVLAREVRQRFPGTGRVLVSGTLDQHLSPDDPSLFDATLAKPYTRQPLVEAIHIAYAAGLARRNP